MRSKALIAVLLAVAAPAREYQTATSAYRYEFPRDHFSHPNFQTEWWYYTGNLTTKNGRLFGFELTFFRHAVRADQVQSTWDVRDVWLAHFAVSDIDGQRFFHTERVNRTGDALAGADLNASKVWNGNWSVEWHNNQQTLVARAEQFSVQLRLSSVKPPVIHGVNGVSQKAAGAGRASHYVSLTRLQSEGIIKIGSESFDVTGLTWMDHEFFTHQLESQQKGWDWISLQMDNGTELMLFRLRRKDGSTDPFSAGTYVDRAGNATQLGVNDFRLTPGATWHSSGTGADYPIAWTVEVPKLKISGKLSTRLQNQELTGKVATAPVYWEGAVHFDSTSGLHGRGYLEMTGYAGAVNMGN